MKDVLVAPGRAVTLIVREVVIRGGSSVEMRRLADALSPALGRAFVPHSAAQELWPSYAPADRVARKVHAAVMARVERMP